MTAITKPFYISNGDENDPRPYWRLGADVYINYLARDSDNIPYFLTKADYRVTIRHELGHAFVFRAEDSGAYYDGVGNGLMAGPATRTSYLSDEEKAVLACAYDHASYDAWANEPLNILSLQDGLLAYDGDDVLHGELVVAQGRNAAGVWRIASGQHENSSGINTISVDSGYESYRVLVGQGKSTRYVSASIDVCGGATKAEGGDRVIIQRVKAVEKTVFDYGQTIVVAGPDSFVNRYVSHMEDIWDEGYGLVPVSVISNGLTGAEIRTAIRDNSSNARYVLLLGDAVDYKCVDPNGEYYDEMWQTDVELNIYNNYLPDLSMGSDEDIVPTRYVKHMDIVTGTGASFVPYFASDLHYASFVSDERELEYRIGRIPASTVAELMLYLEKRIYYYNYYERALEPVCFAPFDDTNHSIEYSDIGAYIHNGLAAVRDQVLANNGHYFQYKIPHVGWDLEGEWERLRPEVVFMLSTMGSLDGIMFRYEPGSGGPADILTVSNVCTMFGYYCHAASFSLSKRSLASERVLFDNGVGCIAVVGFTGKVSSRLIEEFAGETACAMWGADTVGDIHMTVYNSINSNSLLAPFERHAIQSYAILGDPTVQIRYSPYHQENVSVDPRVEDDVLSVFPQPANAGVRVEFKNNTEDEVSIDIYDVRGKRVFSQQAAEGHSRIHFTWRGRSADGKILPSGVYYMRVTSGDREYGQKVVLVR